MPKPIAADDIYRIQQPTKCCLSPHEDNVAVVVNRFDKDSLKLRSHIWLVPTRGGTPRQFTHGKSADHSPRFSPDGRTLAFISNRSGKSEVWMMPTDGGEAHQLTKLEGNVSELAFRPSGRQLVVSYTPRDEDAKEREKKKKRGEPGQELPRARFLDRIFYKLDGVGFIPKGRTHLWLIDCRTGHARQLTSDDRYDETQPVFSPDGRWIYFASNRSADPDLNLMRIDIWRIPARGGSLEAIRTFQGPSYNFSLSPDGQWIAFLGTKDPDASWGREHAKLWLVPATGGRPTELTERLDRSCENTTISDTFGVGETDPPVWSPDSSWVYFVVSNQGNDEFWRVNLVKRLPTPVINRPGAVINVAAGFASQSLYATFSDPKTPGELVQFKGNGKSTVKTLTSWNDWLKERTVFQPEEFWFHGKRRHRLQGWILRPSRRSARRGPGILYIHGGPATQYGRVLFHEFQYLVGKGYTVFYCNPRGGTGYSEKHLAAIHNAWGTIDYDDLMVFTDEVIRRAHLDRRRLGVAGGSYGGYMTNWIIGHTNRFAAAVTQRSVVNLMSFAGTSDFGFAWHRVFGGDPAWRNPDHYLKMSPILYVDNVRTPTLIEHQENDDRCPIEQAEQLYAALKARNVPTEFHRYPGESHGMSRNGRPDRRITRMERTVGWFDRWLRVKRRRR